jgi:magnesium-transporting ATPase (P-type)
LRRLIRTDVTGHELSSFLPIDASRALRTRGGCRDQELFSISLLTAAQSCHRLGSSCDGIPAAEAAQRLAQYGHNLVTREGKPTIAQELWSRAKNPLNALLLTLASLAASMLFSYAILTHLVKVWFVRRWGM